MARRTILPSVRLHMDMEDWPGLGLGPALAKHFKRRAHRDHNTVSCAIPQLAAEPQHWLWPLEHESSRRCPESRRDSRGDEARLLSARGDDAAVDVARQITSKKKRRRLIGALAIQRGQPDV
eukprot:CAMPEP_0206170866 /NCGR_PEP_ID=MMETSP1474-20131121/40493_1 /ASSEMBLY_ACC=CAM_ASM_001110 /TAXON_ID=97495 /ORGANISM="Imantonia sp., Strain RCC918" /LENGTH=121 /DNA_ID=CAMNT_0053577901 /DNA_START=181 /DNA_END=543 /DNA_ORIENTATION=-